MNDRDNHPNLLQFIEEYFHGDEKTVEAAFYFIWQQLHPNLLLGLLAVRQFQRLLRSVAEELDEQQGKRRRFHLDDQSLLKTPRSIIAKMITVRASGSAVPAGQVSAIQARLASRAQDNPFRDLQSHLDRYAKYLRTGQATSAAETILDLSSNEQGASRTQVFQEAKVQLSRGGRNPSKGEVRLLFDMLVHDYYLHAPGPDTVAFRCQAIRRWWRQRRDLP